AENAEGLAPAWRRRARVATKEAGQVPRWACALGLRASRKCFGGELVAPDVECGLPYSAASSSVSPSWRIISRARSASSYAAETSACTLAAASSISGERRTLR